MDIVEFARRRLGFEPDAHQERVLRSTAKRGILNCSRQWGKSTVAAAKAVHRAYTQAGCLVMVASPCLRQSSEFMRKAAGLLRKLHIRPKTDGQNRVSLVLPNGSRLVGLPGKEDFVRGFSAVSLLLIDEAARVDDAMYRALRPMLAVSRGDIWIMSTPRGKRGFFYSAWEHEGDKWERVGVPATECPRIDKDFLEEERRAMGENVFRQEFMCEFIDSSMSMFARTLVEKSLEDSVTPFDFDLLEFTFDRVKA